ncbi:hypothetical protein E2C01_026482 [Portunus trituberculatus]|uniref:Uncharacterized protein n=1 Tax=Portunus trituberculatus TaxID=210409 RepID=A0A5B7EIZ5_PORTR|nr:hypothetical protein [Portunus trituberculatus]
MFGKFKNRLSMIPGRISRPLCIHYAEMGL